MLESLNGGKGSAPLGGMGDGRWAEPYLTRDGWAVEECLELHADERASVSDWEILGRLFVSEFKPEYVQRSEG